jgi:hypothetical protein
MENVEEVRQRIKELMNLKGLNFNSMSNENNSLRVKLTRQIGEGKTLTCDVILYILVQFPNTSAEWLLRGEGSMEKGAKALQVQFGNVLNNTLVQTIDSLNTTITMLKERLQAYEQPKKVSDAV